MKQLLTRKQRSRLNLCLMALLSAAVVVGGLLASIWMDRLVPTFIGEVKRMGEAEAAAPFFSWSENINLSIYPWSQYNPAQSRPVEGEEAVSLKGVDDYIYSLLGEAQYTDDEVGNRALFEKFSISAEAVSKGRYAFLKDAAVALADGRRYLVNCAASALDGQIVYLHYRNVEAPKATRAELNAAHQKLEGYLRQLYGVYVADGEKYDEEQFRPVEDEAVSFFNSLLGTLQFWQDTAYANKQMVSASMLLYAVQHEADRPELLTAENELLLIYTVDTRTRVILFVEPQNFDIVGYSIQME